MAKMLRMKTGAVRSNAEGKIDYRGFISPLAAKRFGRYMMKHQTQADGKRRASDNWKLGMAPERYIESLVRHIFDFWAEWERGSGARSEVLEEESSAIAFNIQGYMHEMEKASGGTNVGRSTRAQGGSKKRQSP